MREEADRLSSILTKAGEELHVTLLKNLKELMQMNEFTGDAYDYEKLDGFSSSRGFGHFIKSIRLAKGVSRPDVANGTGIPISYIRNIEKGITDKIPNPKRMRSLAMYFGVSIHNLLFYAGYLNSPEKVE